MSEANTWAGIEGDEDIRVRSEVFGSTLVDEAVGVELMGYRGR